MNRDNLGVGTAAPAHKAELIDASNTGLRVQTNATGGTVASFGGFGAFQIDAPGSAGGRFTISESGNVGVGTASPAAKLDVAGSVRIGGDTPMSSNPHMSFSGFMPGTLCISGDITCGGGNCGYCNAGSFVPDKDIQITRLTMSLHDPIDPSCVLHSLWIKDTSSYATLYEGSLPLNSPYGDSGPITVNVPRGEQIALLAEACCCTGLVSGGGNLFVNAQYVMR